MKSLVLVCLLAISALGQSSGAKTVQATPVAGWWNAGSTTPLLVIQGLQDVVAPPENGHMMKEEMGDRVELIDIEGAGHAMLPEQPEKIAAAIIAFARRLVP